MTLLSPDDVALRFAVKRSTILDWCERRYIPYHKMGRNIRFTEKDVESFLQKTKVKSVSEIL